MQGFNMGRYVPPELEGTVTGNQLSRKRAPGTLRSDGSQTVRFEMPFAVWCHGCSPREIIAQGVRFNAIKTKVGYYHSTPIWNFKLKHVACGHSIEIRTDPKKTAYVVVAGGQARDYGSDEVLREGEAGVPILTAAEREQRREDAFARLEDRVQDKKVAKEDGQRIKELYRDRNRDWGDPFEANRRLRTGFRQERKALERENKANEQLKERIGTNMEILPETAEDAKQAQQVAFRARNTEQWNGSSSKPFLKPPSTKARPAVSGRPSRIEKHEQHKRAVQDMLIHNTREAMNPFGGAFKKS